ncbi:DUF6268 family outer membrane beta-barrel protein [Chitinophaga sp. GbtcB8]|uniref:DUF6268 family outer membrane beta-barrel protein n=1 Tax=Chitinophaga sp. GbtcB8 TaxID=2824753 RepID=UPI001C307CC6|nr:DUF6268 family outer membrane beta-barrel protein [Chitinophaga sp. GbtcB8]
MKKLLFFVFMIVGNSDINAQVKVMFKTEYFGKSGYRVTKDGRNERVGNSEGSAMVYEGGVNIPLYEKLDENNRPTLWTINVGGEYAKLDNKNFTEPLVIDEILNIGLSLNHVRPLNNRWSMMATVGGGIYMPGTRLSQISFKNVLGSVGAVFIYHLKPNLQLGAGLAINNSFGYPMLFPAFYINWQTKGKYAVKVAAMKGLEMSVRYNAYENLSLSFIAELNGQMALLEQDGKDKIFAHQYLVAGFRPEIKIGKKVSIPITAGISATRPAKMMDRKLKSIFQDGGYHFQAAPYVSAGLQIRF